MSEFDLYVDLHFVDLGHGHYCLERGRYLKKRNLGDVADDLDRNYEQVEELASRLVLFGNVDKLAEASEIENGLDPVLAKLELEARYPWPERN